jgi:hypothetical protein
MEEGRREVGEREDEEDQEREDECVDVASTNGAPQVSETISNIFLQRNLKCLKTLLFLLNLRILKKVMGIGRQIWM